MADRATNISDRGIRLRGRAGIAWLILGVIAAIVLVTTGSPRTWRLFLFIPFALAANGIFQAREKTCVLLAALGKREGAEGRSYEQVAAEENMALRRRAVSIVARSVVIAAVITGVIWRI